MERIIKPGFTTKCGTSDSVRYFYHNFALFFDMKCSCSYHTTSKLGIFLLMWCLFVFIQYILPFDPVHVVIIVASSKLFTQICHVKKNLSVESLGRTLNRHNREKNDKET